MILDDFKLDGKVAMVTGASRGLGRAIAEGLAEAGADLVLVATNAALLEKVASHIAKLGRKTLVFPCDVTDETKLDALVATTLDTFGRIDVLVNAHGVQARHPAEDFPADAFDRVLDVNLRSVFMLTQRVGRVMIAQKSGKIINVASLASELAGRNIVPYTVSKGGVRQLTRGLAREWASHGVCVNAIGPGYFRTDMTEALWQDAGRKGEILKRVPMGRWGDAGELKGAAVFLASRASDYLTGQVVYVDGGYLIS